MYGEEGRRGSGMGGVKRGESPIRAMKFWEVMYQHTLKWSWQGRGMY